MMDLRCARCVAKYFKINQILCCKFETNISISCLWFLWWCMCKVLKISARFLKILQGSSFRTICRSVQESYCHMTKSCRSHFLNPHLDCNLDVIFAEVGNVHLEFFKLTPFSRKLSRDRRSQTIGTSQVHMAITLTITMVCRHNISFLQNSSHHCHPIDFPWKCWKRCWLLDGRLATEPTGSSLRTEQQPDQTPHTDWGWALSCRGSWPQKILLEHQKYSRITENSIIGPRGHTWSGHN